MIARFWGCVNCRFLPYPLRYKLSGNGYYSPSHQDNALKELRQTSSFTGAYTNIDDAEIEQAMKSTIPDGLLEGFPSPSATC